MNGNSPNTTQCPPIMSGGQLNVGFLDSHDDKTYALWESKKLKPMLMGKDLAKHPPTPGGGIKVTW